MVRRRRPPLVAEIARLLVEYPERDWRALVDRLRDPTLIGEIATAIDDAVSAAKRSTGKTKKERRGPRVNVLAEVARKDEAKAEILAALNSRLNDKDQAVTLAYIRDLATSLGMKEELTVGRQQAINQILSYLATKTTDEIESALKTALSMQQPQGQEFDRWVDLILGSNPNSERHKRSVGDD